MPFLQKIDCTEDFVTGSTLVQKFCQFELDYSIGIFFNNSIASSQLMRRLGSKRISR